MTTQSLFDLVARIKDYGSLKTPDFLAYSTPILEKVKYLHEQNQVAKLTHINKIEYRDNRLDFSSAPSSIQFTSKKLFVKPFATGGLDVERGYTEKLNIDDSSSEFKHREMHLEEDKLPSEAAYLLHYQSWENALGHYDPMTDIFILGLVLASVAYGLDFREKKDLKKFVLNRKRLVFLNNSLHPTVHSVIHDMTQLYREDRLPNLDEAITKLKNYREYNPENYVDLTATEGFRNQDTSTRGKWILARLKNRLFDISRRNKLLYFKEQQSFVNLTVSSVPLLLDYENVKEQDLIVWNDNIKNKVVRNKKIDVNEFIDLNENKYLGPTLNKIRLEARRSQNEYGFSQLRVVIAFLHWYNFKEDETERITSPLLLLPVKMLKKKGVQDKFTIQFEDTEAEINPILSNYLKELYDISLPNFIDLDSTSIQELIEGVEQQIASDGSGIKIEWRKRPRIKLIHTIARKNHRLKTHKLTNRTAALNLRSFHYSYDQQEFAPLGLQLFKDRIRYKNNALEYVINDSLSPSNNAVEQKERTFYTTDNEGDINPMIWEVDTCNITVGNFNYRKMSLVRDYNEIIDSNVKDEIFDMLFSELPQGKKDSNFTSTSLKENFPIIEADPTQTNAIKLARTGQSYIIQGPPGTGKSQTITNLIADFVARGKKVLFVCEKRAALDVVFHRLKNRKLDELCCLIHDSQADKKSFILNLKETSEQFTSNEVNLLEVENERNTVISMIEKEIAELTFFHSQMKLGSVTPLTLFEVLHNTGKGESLPTDTELMYLPTYEEWEKNSEWVQEWLQQLKNTGARPSISSYIYKNLSQEICESANPKKKALMAIERAEELLDQWLEVVDQLSVSIAEDASFVHLEKVLNGVKKLKGLAERRKLNVLKKNTSQAKELAKTLEEITALEKQLQKIEQTNTHWKNKWSKEDAEQALINWRRFSKSFLRFLNPSYYKLKGLIKKSYHFEAHAVTPEIEKLLHNLNEEYKTHTELVIAKDKVKDNLGIQHWEELEWIIAGQQHFDTEVGTWIEQEDAQSILEVAGQASVFEELKSECELLFGPMQTLKIDQVDQNLQKAKEHIGSLVSMIPFVMKVKTVSPEMSATLYQKDWEIRDFAFHASYKSLKLLYDKQAKFAAIEEDKLQLSIRRINGLLEKYYESNVRLIKAMIREKYMNMIRVTDSVAAQLTAEEKLLKKKWVGARKVLENEFGKSMRYKSVRELAGNETNSMLTALKPVWLMSPLSVSDTMPIDVDLFDVVIYDEASQITVEEGVPSLYRTKQTIIVGDEMQMPPTNFFSSGSTSDEEESAIEDQIGITLDADSLLNQGSRKLSSVMLGWHYRSRHESLISFSNAAFYKRELLTIPDNVIYQSREGEASSVVDINEPIDIEGMLSKSISYHYLENATYIKRKNADEAAYIANMVKQLLAHPDNRSIGVVAFSMDQQSEIETALQRLCENDREFEARLEQEYQRMDKDQFNGLFVKNLENVQGDERDVIIMSVCYGYNNAGKMYMNFGPINRRGGEKRLNVIFSRAKRNMVVVSSIQPQDIKNDYNEGANYFKRFLSYARFISEGRLNEASTILDGMASESEETTQHSSMIVQQLKSALNDLGYEVDTQVGQSHFKCDVGVKIAGEERYKLGILIDNAHHYATGDVLELYCQRPEILRAFGWQIIRVLNKDWFEQKDRVLEKIKRLLENPNDIVEEPYLDEIEADLAKTESVVLPTHTPDNVEADDSETTAQGEIDDLVEVETNTVSETNDEIQFDRYEFTEGSSNKYWEIAQDDCQLYIRYGRIGNKAQTSTKSFETLQKAALEKTKLIAKKVKKGYVEKPLREK